MSLTGHWSGAWKMLDLGLPEPEVFDDLVTRYTEPHRAYHTLQHLEECLARFDEAGALAERPGELLVGLWFHDAFYDTHSADNEVRSAMLAGETMRATGAGGDLVHRVHDLILATRHDAVPAVGDQALIADIDLAILAAPTPRFDEYEDQVRREYDWVPEPAFRESRARILTGFLDRREIFFTAHFRGLLEEQARANLSRSLSRLTGGR